MAETQDHKDEQKQDDKTFLCESYSNEEKGQLVYYANDDRGYTYRMELKENRISETEIANHTARVTEIITRTDGINSKEEIMIEVVLDGVTYPPKALSRTDILTEKKARGELYAGCTLSTTLKKNEREIYYVDMLEKQCLHCKHVTIYTRMGFIKINDEWVFLNGDYSVTKDGLTDEYTVDLSDSGMTRYKFMPCEDDEDIIYDTLLTDLFNLAPDNKYITFSLLAYTFIAPLNTIMDEQGCKNDFGFYLIAKTQSFKSTLARLFLCFFGDFPRKSELPFNFNGDSAGGIKKGMTVLNSTLTVVDDLTPATGSYETAKNKEIEEVIARVTGNRGGEKKLTQQREFNNSPPTSCNVIVTAEEAYGGLPPSSIARSLSCELTREMIDVKTLKKLQHNSHHLNYIMSQYICWIINQWDCIQSEVQELFENYSDDIVPDIFGRGNEIKAYLQIGIHYLCKYLIHKNRMTEQQAETLEADCLNMFVELLKKHNERIETAKPTTLFLTGFKNLLDSGAIKPLSRDKYIKGTMSNSLVIEDDKYFFVRKNYIYEKVYSYYKKLDVYMTREAELFKQLRAEGIIEVDTTRKPKRKTKTGYGQYEKSVTMSSESLRFVHIHKRFIDDL